MAAAIDVCKATGEGAAATTNKEAAGPHIDDTGYCSHTHKPKQGPHGTWVGTKLS